MTDTPKLRHARQYATAISRLQNEAARERRLRLAAEAELERIRTQFTTTTQSLTEASR